MIRGVSFWFQWWLVVIADLCLALGWMFSAAALESDGNAGEWLLLWFFPAMALTLTLATGIHHGWRFAGYATLTAVTIVAILFQVHASFRLAYLDGDVAKDTMIYNTTSPDIPELARELRALSRTIPGDIPLAIQVEACESIDWVMRWYLRDMPGVSYLRSIPGNPAERAPVIIGSIPDWSGGSCSTPEYLPGYTSQQLVLRWHEPEWAVYRYFAIAPELSPGWSAWRSDEAAHDVPAVIGSVVESLAFAVTPAGQKKLFDLLMYRDAHAPLSPFLINVYIRNDLVPQFNDIRYGSD